MTTIPRTAAVASPAATRYAARRPSRRWTGIARIVGWGAVLAAGHRVVARTGTVLAPPAGLAPDQLVEWAGAEPVLLAFSMLRLLAVALLWYFTALSMLAVASRLTGLAPLARLTWAVALPATRRHVARAVGVGFTAGVIVPVGALGLTGSALAQTSEPVVTMHVVDESPAPRPPEPGGAGAPTTPATSPPVRMALVDAEPPTATGTGTGTGTGTTEHATAPEPAPTPDPAATPVEPHPAPAPDAPATAPATATSPAAATGGIASSAAGGDRATASAAGSARPPLVMRLVPEARGPAAPSDPSAAPDPAAAPPADPSGSPSSPSDAATAPAPAAPSTGAGPRGPGAWTIAPGDHLWHVAEATLTAGWGRAPDERAVTTYWRRLIEHNADRLVVAGEPDLVLPGQVFALPPLPEPTT